MNINKHSILKIKIHFSKNLFDNEVRVADFSSNNCWYKYIVLIDHQSKSLNY